MVNPDQLDIQLSPEELDILSGAHGEVLQKVMETVVLFGEALGAERLVEIEGSGHFVIPWCYPGIAPPIVMLEELVHAGLKTKFPFTLDPYPPLDFENLNLEAEVEEAIKAMYADQDRYDELISQLGLRDDQAYTCNPYQPEVGNIPERGTILAWSESACAIYANSVLGARTNRNGAIMDLLLNVLGKTPLAGLVTDEGRKADWLVDVRMQRLPDPHLLGAVIGLKLLSGVPFIAGLDRFLNPDLDDDTRDYLQEMGAMIATYSAVDLFHVEHITPEAADQGRDLLQPAYDSCTINESDLESMLDSFPVQWDDPEAKPEKCYIGCPHLSLDQIYAWAKRIEEELSAQGQEHLAVETVLCAAPQVLEKFQADQDAYQRMLKVGARFSPTCSETIFETGLCAGRPVITSSNKLRAYTSARYFGDRKLVEILVKGKVDG